MPTVKYRGWLKRRHPDWASFYVFSAALSLLIAGILLLSKKFATEFAYERKHLPRYKTFLKWSFGGAAILAMIIASFKDILHAAH